MLIKKLYFKKWKKKLWQGNKTKQLTSWRKAVISKFNVFVAARTRVYKWALSDFNEALCFTLAPILNRRRHVEGAIEKWYISKSTSAANWLDLRNSKLRAFSVNYFVSKQGCRSGSWKQKRWKRLIFVEAEAVALWWKRLEVEAKELKRSWKRKQFFQNQALPDFQTAGFNRWGKMLQ